MLLRFMILLLLSISWSFPASGEAAIEEIARFESITIGDEPTVCIPDKAIHLTPPNKIWKVCRADGTGFDDPFLLATDPPEDQDVLTFDEELGRGVWRASPAGTTTTGIRTTATDIRTIRYEVTELGPGTFTLDLHHRIWVTVSTVGVVFNLPDASLPSTPSDYELIIKDTGTGFMSLIPFGAQTINFINNSPPAITGQGSRYIVKRVGDTAWDLLQVVPLAFPGALSGCTLSDGDINTATGATDLLLHNLRCTLPANFFTLHREIEACASWKITTGSAAPGLKLRVRAGSTILAETGGVTASSNITDDYYTTCFFLHANAAPSASSNVYTSIRASGSALVTFSQRVASTQPVAVATNAPITLAFESEWDAAGTGTSTFQLLFASFHARN